MPELPEVENLRRGLVAKIKGQTIKRVKVLAPKLVSGKGNIRKASPQKTGVFVRGLRGEKIQEIERRAKNLIFHFYSGKIVLIHLKMSGQLVYRERNKNLVEGGHPIQLSEMQLPNKHTRVIFELSKGVLYYNDTRMFGYLLYYPTIGTLIRENHFHRLGLEPFDPHFNLKYLAEELKKKSGRIKTVLMGQEIVTGLGNIYCDEVCFAANIRPTRRASSLKPNEIKKLHLAIQHILKRAIEMGGSSVVNYRLADGSRGNYAREHRVYGKSGKPCVICGENLKKIMVNGRSTVYCAKCQV
ncbi:MAG: bifunctional DNA-formamidopyrimidine glycosylase/DNA-(apurinic or apyrimidinic site) lyase [Candidatus Liptonbacteria bacterium]